METLSNTEPSILRSLESDDECVVDLLADVISFVGRNNHVDTVQVRGFRILFSQ